MARARERMRGRSIRWRGIDYPSASGTTSRGKLDTAEMIDTIYGLQDGRGVVGSDGKHMAPFKADG